MGNCQAIDAAALVIQHPNGRIDRMYWAVSASEVMKMNPGHYVSLIIPLPAAEEEKEDQKAVRFTRVKLLRPNENLVLGHAYRLITSQDVMKVLRAKKYAKMKQQQPQPESVEKMQVVVHQKQSSDCEAEGKPDMENKIQAVKRERRRLKTTSTNPAEARSKSWRPSLYSISEAGS